MYLYIFANSAIRQHPDPPTPVDLKRMLLTQELLNVVYWSNGRYYRILSDGLAMHEVPAAILEKDCEGAESPYHN